MNLYANQRVRILQDKVTRIKRRLQGKGKFTVKVGQEVVPDDRIGHSVYPSGYRNINIAKDLSVSPSEAKKLLQRPIGQRIFKGELIAFKKGGILSGKKVIISPTDGILYSYDQSTGELRLEFFPKEIDLPAAVFGLVETVDHLKGEVVIKTQVTEIFGIMGSGKLKTGQIKVIGSRGDLITKVSIYDNLSDHILVGGGLIYKDAITRAVETGVRGIITGGINAKDYKTISGGRLQTRVKFGTDIGVGVLVTEGFGSIPIGEDIFEVLTSHEDRFAILEGNRAKLTLPSHESDCMIKIRQTSLPQVPEDLVEMPVEVEAMELKTGQRVRLISLPFLGEQGVIEAIDQTPSLLPSQIATYMVTVTTKKRKIRVPYTNLEVISEK